MRSYTEREVFGDASQALWADAVAIVERIPSTWGNELRCHELSRAVAELLRLRGGSWFITSAVKVVDGKLGAIEHSWLVCVQRTRGGTTYVKQPILDVYCPGRMPQVQLIDDYFAVSRGYEIGEPRTDIKHDIVRKLVDDFGRS